MGDVHFGTSLFNSPFGAPSLLVSAWGGTVLDADFKLRDYQHTSRWGEDSAIVLNLPDSPVAMVAGDAFRGSTRNLGACVLLENGAIHCEGSDVWNRMSFPNTYRMISGEAGTVCAVRDSDDAVECQNGEEWNFGELKAMNAVPRHLIYADSQTVGFCVLTMQNTIHCVGEFMDEEIQAQLAVVNDQNRIEL